MAPVSPVFWPLFTVIALAFAPKVLMATWLDRLPTRFAALPARKLSVAPLLALRVRVPTVSVEGTPAGAGALGPVVIVLLPPDRFTVPSVAVVLNPMLLLARYVRLAPFSVTSVPAAMRLATMALVLLSIVSVDPVLTVTLDVPRML